MKKLQLTVISCTETVNKNYCVKLKGEEETYVVETEFGNVEQTRTPHYYMFFATPVEVGLTAPLDLDQFDMVEKPFRDTDEETGKEINAMLKYLYPKRLEKNRKKKSVSEE